MFKNHLKIAIRNLLRQKAYSFINISGLAIGMACCILLVLYIHSELSFDNYHLRGDRIYRLSAHIKIGERDFETPVSNAVAAAAMREDYPEVLHTARFRQMPGATVRYEDKLFFENNILYADNSVFDIFSWPMIKGKPGTALDAPYSIVISEALAEKYFGNQNPLGKVLRFNDKDEYTVTGVIQNIPQNSHFVFDGLCSFETLYSMDGKDLSLILSDWLSFNFRTYVLLEKGADFHELEKKFPAMLEKYAGNEMRAKGGEYEYFLHPLEDIYLRPAGQSGSSPIFYVYIFSGIALLVLLIACVNFMNLSTARSARRAREVGIRKVLGANKGKLISQFLGETLLLSLLSLIIAFVLVEFALPFISDLSGRELNLNLNTLKWLVPGSVGLLIFVGIVSGSYPAFFLSGFQPVKVLKSQLKKGVSHSRLRGILVVSQFSISIMLIIGTGLIIGQLDYMKKKHPGFNKEHVVVIPARDDRIQNSLKVIKNELKTCPGVVSVAASSTIPAGGAPSNDKIPEGYTREQTQLMDEINIDGDFIPTLGMEIVAGRNFFPESGADERHSVIINETAVKRFGWENPLGKSIKSINPENPDNWVPKTVIGVVKDFHLRSLSRVIEPLYINNESSPAFWFNSLDMISVRIKADDIAGTMDAIEEKWMKTFPFSPFNYFFLEDSFERQFRDIKRSRGIFSYFTFLAIFIACLGLFGMASFSAEQRTKEIGIRKVLGASLCGIVLSLSREFVKWVLAANVAAWPVAYIAMNSWLQNFAYRINIGIWIFLLSGALALVIALLTVGYQAIKAAVANPVESLRYE